MWTGLIWLRMGTCERGMNRKVSCTEELLAGQEGSRLGAELLL